MEPADLPDWSFAEGGREGATKLQGTLPLDEARPRRGARRLADELREFLASTDGSEEDRALTAVTLDCLGREPAEGRQSARRRSEGNSETA